MASHVRTRRASNHCGAQDEQAACIYPQQTTQFFKTGPLGSAFPIMYHLGHRVISFHKSSEIWTTSILTLPCISACPE